MQQPPAHPPQQPPLPASYPADRPTNSLAIVSLVAGLASYVVVPVIGAVVAIITGHMARGQIRRTEESGSGLALAGLILGYVHLLLVLIVVAIVVILTIVAGVAIFGSTRH
ncbi:MAG TPA: DUF4190 domain-containing protein [Candidatus Dormibacteraeota bacterium]